MSRLGKKPVPIAKGAKVSVAGNTVKVQGPKGNLEYAFPAGISVNVDEGKGEVVIARANDERQQKAFHGLTRSLINNMIIGVTSGYKKSLEVQGVGYKVEQKGKNLVLSVGFANPITLAIPGNVAVQLEGANIIHVSGADKQAVGEFAAQVRKVRKPEPYKGKGVRYLGEQVKIKPGKAFAGAGAK